MILGVNASPNRAGRTARLVESTLYGAKRTGAAVGSINLADFRVGVCQACKGGWGPHFPPNTADARNCRLKDDFPLLQEQIRSCEVLVFASPVYFGDISELAKTFLDRLRRCNWPPRESPLSGKCLVSIAVGDTGNGALETLAAIEKYFLTNMGMRRGLAFAVTTSNQSTMMPLIAAAVTELAQLGNR